MCSSAALDVPIDESDSNKGTSSLTSAAACIDGERAFAHVEKIVSFAPRHAGTPGIKKTREYIVNTLSRMGLPPKIHRFTAYTPHPDMPTVEMANISVGFAGSSVQRVLISGHFDGKIIEKGTFYGANDGGSSTGLLLEMARCLKKFPPKQSVQLVFFDGEEALVTWTDSDSLYGSKNFVAQLASANEIEQISAMINIDMVADKRLAFFNETNSTPWVFAALRVAAAKIGKETLFSGPHAAVGDDHLPFLDKNIPAANLIDLRFGPGWRSNAYWHTEDDDLSHISAQSMEDTGQIIFSALPALMGEHSGRKP